MGSQYKEPTEEMGRQLLAMKLLLKMTGAMHEFQILQLKYWSVLVFPNTKNSSFTWDVDKKMVYFKIVTKKKVSMIREKSKRLDIWTKGILGEEWGIVVSLRVLPDKGWVEVYHSEFEPKLAIESKPGPA